MTRIAVLALIASACTRPAPRAPEAPRRGVVIMSLHDVEPYEHVPPPSPQPPPKIELAAPLYGALAGAVTGVMLNAGLTLLTEHRWPNRAHDRERANKAMLYGAGIGLVGGSYALGHSIAERLKWRREQVLNQNSAPAR